MAFPEYITALEHKKTVFVSCGGEHSAILSKVCLNLNSFSSTQPRKNDIPYSFKNSKLYKLCMCKYCDSQYKKEGKHQIKRHIYKYNFYGDIQAFNFFFNSRFRPFLEDIILKSGSCFQRNKVLAARL